MANPNPRRSRSCRKRFSLNHGSGRPFGGVCTDFPVSVVQWIGPLFPRQVMPVRVRPDAPAVAFCPNLLFFEPSHIQVLTNAAGRVECFLSSLSTSIVPVQAKPSLYESDHETHVPIPPTRPAVDAVAGVRALGSEGRLDLADLQRGPPRAWSDACVVDTQHANLNPGPSGENLSGFLFSGCRGTHPHCGVDGLSQFESMCVRAWRQRRPVATACLGAFASQQGPCASPSTATAVFRQALGSPFPQSAGGQPSTPNAWRMWRNWQTHQFQVLAPQGVRVRVSPSAPAFLWSVSSAR